ncbi:MAG: phage terminase large subunit [Candidatus Uhrbacteria bacterium]|nr:phage terminase large subunit [Candidatus Uhrbacteria bacterium]
MKTIKKKAKLTERILRDRKVRKEIVAKSLDWFFSIYLHKYIQYETAPFQKKMIAIAENQSIKMAIIVAFRNSAKSTIITTASVIWSILGIPQKKFVIILSQTEQKARQHLQNIKRELEENELLRRDLGPFDEERNQWGATALIIKKFNAKIMIGSAEQTIRGLRFGAHRPDLIIIDDVEDTSSVRTQEGRDKTYNWLTSEVLPAGDKNTKVIAVGNLLHEDSLLKRLEAQIKNKEVDGVYEEFPIVDDNGNILWPGKYPDMNAIDEERRRTASYVSWMREYLLKIISDDRQLIPREWIKYYEGSAPDKYCKYSATGVDLAISQSSNADFTAMVSAKVYGKRDTLQVYILPNIVNKRLTSLETLDHAKNISRSLGRTTLFIEDVGYQSSLIEHLKRDNYPAEGVKTHGQDKYARLSAVSHLVQSGKVMFPQHGAEHLICQLTGFGVEKHDDLVDAFSILLSQIIEKDNKTDPIMMCFRGKYNGEFDHLPPDEKEKMMRIRENLRNMFLL